MRGKTMILCSAMLAVGFLASEALHAQQGIKRTPLQKDEVPGSNYEAVFGLAEVPAGASVGRHTHPGVEMGYLIEGEGVLLVDGQGERAIKAGDSWRIEAGKPHDARITASTPAKVVAVYIVEKGKPLASPAP
jgi:quercetin dioxygenase-like cupin family protein